MALSRMCRKSQCVKCHHITCNRMAIVFFLVETGGWISSSVSGDKVLDRELHVNSAEWESAVLKPPCQEAISGGNSSQTRRKLDGSYTFSIDDFYISMFVVDLNNILVKFSILRTFLESLDRTWFFKPTFIAPRPNAMRLWYREVGHANRFSADFGRKSCLVRRARWDYSPGISRACVNWTSRVLIYIDNTLIFVRAIFKIYLILNEFPLLCVYYY